MLSIALPRAGTNAATARATLDLYFSLLSRAGVTGKMLASACERFIMAPNGGKAKFFPDPGQLAEMCADDIKDRHRLLGGMDCALALLENPPPVDEHHDTEGRRATLHALGERLATLKTVRRIPSTSRPCTDAEELKSHLEKKLAS